MYLSLARKYRPKRFADVAVQSHVATTLRGAIERGRVAHGYLLCGPRGVGKTTLARVLAMALNCERRGAGASATGASASDQSGLGRGAGASATGASASDQSGFAGGAGEPCGDCTSCQRIWRGETSLDVIEIDAASNRGVDDARELRERAMYAPSADDRYKVYIVDEAHMLTREAWNALLKILEEPPPRVVFVFATTEPHKIAQSAAPVLSRLQRFDFKRIGPAEVRERLSQVLSQEGVEAEPEALAMLARAADGSMRDALSLADQVLATGDARVTVARVREALGLVAEDEYLTMVDIVAGRRAAEVFPAVARLVEAGTDLGQFLAGFADMLRAQLAISLGGEAPELSEHARRALLERAGRLPPADLLRMLSAIGELEPHFRRSGQQQLLLETLLVRFALLDRSVELEDLLRGLGGGQPATASAREESRRADSRRDESRRESIEPPRTSRDVPATTRDGGRSRALGASVAVAAQSVDDGPATVLELNPLVERWGEVVERVRQAGRAMLATALEHTLPVAVTARGGVTLRLEETNDIFEKAILSGGAEVVSAIGQLFARVTRVDVQQPDASRSAEPPRRLTSDSVRAERLAVLRKRDATLDAAVDALDLELLDD